MDRKNIKRLFFSSKGRINRKEFFLTNILFAQAIPFALVVIGFLMKLYVYPSIFWVLWAIILFTIYLIVTSTIKRIRDIGISLGWIVLAFIPWINFIFMFYLLLKKGRE
jgi:uncharacterized membrane protein YhaH (DUF805 family)